MRKIKKKAFPVAAWQLGTGTEKEAELIAKGLIVKKDDGTYAIFSKEATQGEGEVAQAGDYFKIGDGSQAARELTSFNIDFGEDETTEMDPPTISPEGESTEASSLGGWYTINGRKLQNKPTTKGLYIHNGKKIVIR